MWVAVSAGFPEEKAGSKVGEQLRWSATKVGTLHVTEDLRCGGAGLDKASVAGRPFWDVFSMRDSQVPSQCFLLAVT